MIAGAVISHQTFARRAASVATDDDEAGGLGPEFHFNNVLPAAPPAGASAVPSGFPDPGRMRDSTR